MSQPNHTRSGEDGSGIEKWLSDMFGLPFSVNSSKMHHGTPSLPICTELVALIASSFSFRSSDFNPILHIAHFNIKLYGCLRVNPSPPSLHYISKWSQSDLIWLVFAFWEVNRDGIKNGSWRVGSSYFSLRPSSHYINFLLGERGEQETVKVSYCYNNFPW